VLSAKRKKLDRFIQPVLLNRVISPIGSVKYLEVILDAKMTWRKLVKQMKVKLTLAFDCVGPSVRPKVKSRKLFTGFIQVQYGLCVCMRQ
jgi:hypothetical protein